MTDLGPIKRVRATIRVPGRVWLVRDKASIETLPDGERLAVMVGPTLPGARLLLDGRDVGVVVSAAPRGVQSFGGDLEYSYVEETELDLFLTLPNRPTPDIARLLNLILDDMPRATNADLAADGPVGDEEERVWNEIRAEADRIRREVWPGRAS